MENSIIEELIGGMPSWTEEANCKGADADIFFPERGASTRKAKSICRACSVQETVWSLLLKTQKNLESGADFLKEKEEESNVREFMTQTLGTLVKKY